ncbi:MAG: right-handed parallel beta-helix repeat-containing protein [Ardenticatenales bacterium]|nr:right-handed parallel beta-helix repeat-containing protein [Ardenticatenales bacterium]
MIKQRRWQALTIFLSVLTLFGFLVIALPVRADLIGRYKPTGAGGCGNFIDDLAGAEDGDGFLLMTPPQASQGAEITQSITLQGGWSPPNDGCDSSESVYTTTDDLFAAGFIFAPEVRSTLFHDTGPVLTLQPEVVTVTLQNLILEHSSTTTARGGGIYGLISGNDVVRLENIAIQESEVITQGGGLFLELRNGSHLVISDSQIISNTATRGGGFEVRLYENSHLTIHNTEVRANEARTGNGGGVRILVQSGYVTLTESIFTGNQALAGEGGALSIEGVGGDSRLHLFINESSFTGNQALVEDEVSINVTTLIPSGNYFPTLFLPVSRRAP